MKNRVTQKEGIFYILYMRFKDKKIDYVPVFQLMGETYVKEINLWAYVSYECSARASEIMTENPGLLQRIKLRGRSGAKYYGYRLTPAPNIDLFKDPSLLHFYRRVSKNKTPTFAQKSALDATRVFNAL